MNTIDTEDLNVSLARRLSLTTQLYLPGTAGRISQQIRELERVAPDYVKAGYVRKLMPPSPLNLHVGGIATDFKGPVRIMGGFLYAVGGLRTDLKIRDNQIGTGSKNSTCEMDDIDFEDQKLRLKLISIRHAYELAAAALEDGEKRDLLILDTPLLLSRSLSSAREGSLYPNKRQTYEQTLEAIDEFWQTYQDRLFPWNSRGPMLVSIGTGRYGAVLDMAQRDFRSKDTKSFVLEQEQARLKPLENLDKLGSAVLSIGQQRFLTGILESYHRTVAYRMNVQTPQMEPKWLADIGVYGFHFKSAQGTSPLLVQVVGPATGWPTEAFDRLTSWLMALTALGGKKAEPLPVYLSKRELGRPLDVFLQNYAREVHSYLRNRKLEENWLSDFDDFELEGESIL